MLSNIQIISKHGSKPPNTNFRDNMNTYDVISNNGGIFDSFAGRL